MATSADYIEFVMDSLAGVRGELRFKKMFGEYCIYLNDRPVLLVCDNSVYVKMLSVVEHLMAGARTGAPYGGAKEHYLLDIDNQELAIQVVEIIAQNTSLPKPRKSKKQ